LNGFEPDRAKQSCGLFRAEQSEVSWIGVAKTRESLTLRHFRYT